VGEVAYELAGGRAPVLVAYRKRDVFDVEVERESEHQEEEPGHDDEENERPGVPADLPEFLLDDGPQAA
jgi:hypothetical protein